MQGHNKIIFERKIGRTPEQHVIVQMCQHIDYYDNPTVIARSWADVDADWSFVRGLVVEIAIDGDVEADMVLAMALAIQRAGPRQLYVTDDDLNQYAVFWKDHHHKDVEFMWMWN